MTKVPVFSSSGASSLTPRAPGAASGGTTPSPTKTMRPAGLSGANPAMAAIATPNVDVPTAIPPTDDAAPEPKVLGLDSLPTATPPSDAATPRTPVTPPLGSAYERLDLPSNFIPYTWKQFNVRKFDIFDQAKVARAVKLQNFSLLLDALATTTDQDVRDLVMGDFQALCTWHKLWSYPKMESTITWRSRYDNQNKSQAYTKIKTNYLKPTEADYQAILAKGLCMPTVRDLELAIDANLDEEREYLFSKAQYVNLATCQDLLEELRAKNVLVPEIDARIQKLAELSRNEATPLEIIQTINELELNYDCGISEYVMLTDKKDIDWPTWVNRVQAEADPETDIGKDLIAEAAQVQILLNKGQIPTPKEQEVPLAFSPWNHFPII